MNSLSWFLYFAEVLPAMGNVFGWIGLTLIVGTIVHAFACPGEGKELEYPFQGIIEKNVQPKYKWVVFAFLSFFTLYAIPSKETIYLIAGSEAGEAVVTSEEGKEILDDIHLVIKHQLKQLKQ